jgi:hypothetical protein
VSKVTPGELAHQLYFRVMQLDSVHRVHVLVRAQTPTHKVTFGSEQVFTFAQTNMLVFLLSMLFSLFDPSGVDLRDLQTQDADLRARLLRLGAKWQQIEKPLAIVRNTIAFHGAETKKGTLAATSAIHALGTAGLVTAFELIREILFELAPLLRAEAGLTFNMPASLVGALGQLRATCEAADAKWRLAAAETSVDHTKDLDDARVLCEVAYGQYAALRAELGRLVVPEEQQFLSHFDDEWGKQIESRKELIATLVTTTAMLRNLTSLAPPTTAAAPSEEPPPSV